jgi:putative restriction endonuclease
MKIITSYDDLYKNIVRLEAYRAASGGSQYLAYRALVKRGTCFVPYLAANAICFAPSRFVGYESNDIESHVSNDAKDGRVTNEAINIILLAQPVFDARLEDAYQKFCIKIGVAPNATGNFGVQRKYWLTSEIESALSQIAADEATKEP